MLNLIMLNAMWIVWTMNWYIGLDSGNPIRAAATFKNLACYIDSDFWALFCYTDSDIWVVGSWFFLILLILSYWWYFAGNECVNMQLRYLCSSTGFISDLILEEEFSMDDLVMNEWSCFQLKISVCSIVQVHRWSKPYNRTLLRTNDLIFNGCWLLVWFVCYRKYKRLFCNPMFTQNLLEFFIYFECYIEYFGFWILDSVILDFF